MGYFRPVWIRAALLAAAVVLPVGTRADYAVLRNGQRLHITGYERIGESVKLHLRGGYALIPAAALVRIEPEDFQNAAAVVPQPPVFDPFAEWIVEAARSHGLDPALVASVIAVESGFDPRAVSRRNAQGLMQLLPSTAAQLGVRNSFDPRENILAGTRYLAELLTRFAGDLILALAAYNAGPGRVVEHGGIPPIAETRSYIERVLTEYRRRTAALP
ncbi:MAG: lytic transglycosylase domain-containing protein [Firmicutes bacterium]|nr:lytic transglycosylase domain-containing protein [Bacillota bacterium]